MPSVLSRVVFFLSSFSPLLLVFSLLDTWGRGLPSIICAVTAGLAVVFLLLILWWAKMYRTAILCAKVARRKDVEALTYIASFLLPFLTVSTDSLKQKIALGIFMCLIALFYISGETYFWNPILSLLGYRAIEIELRAAEVATLITARSHVPVGAEITAVRLAYNVFWEPRSV